MAIRNIVELENSRSVGRRCTRIIYEVNTRLGFNSNLSLPLAIEQHSLVFTLFSLFSDLDPRKVLSASAVPSTATIGITEKPIRGESDNGLGPSYISTF
jgi:hypothetical protein